MSEYGRYKSSGNKQNPLGDTPAEPAKPTPKPLSDPERAHAQAMQQAWQQHFPNDPFFQELYKAGMVDGWRNIIDIQPLSEADTQ